ncbi:PadR family transcriptional regulator [Vallitalea longa]|uniref:PadR family transcriptional regulator n=1 Tax=Vallitalea longa TaxID=2936439 RepID=UPI002ED28EBF
MERIKKQLKKGTLEIIILRLISKKEMYGYEIIQQLDKASNGFYNLKEGSLYPVLYRLEDSNYIESYMVIEDGKRKITRKYYKITDKGISQIHDYLKEWQNFVFITNKILDIEGDYNE